MRFVDSAAVAFLKGLKIVINKKIYWGMSQFKCREWVVGGRVSSFCVTVFEFSGKITIIHQNELSFLFKILAFTKHLMIKEVVTIYYIKSSISIASKIKRYERYFLLSTLFTWIQVFLYATKLLRV